MYNLIKSLNCSVYFTATVFSFVSCTNKDKNVAPANINEQYIDSSVKAKVDSFRTKLKSLNDSLINEAGVDYADSVKASNESLERLQPPPLPVQKPLNSNKVVPAKR